MPSKSKVKRNKEKEEKKSGLPSVKKKKKKAGNIPKKEKKKCEEKQRGWKWNCMWAFSSKSNAQFSPSIFSQFWRKFFLVSSGRKHLDPTIYFSSFSPNQIYSKKIFLLIFSPKFSIQPISPSNKYTLRGRDGPNGGPSP